MKNLEDQDFQIKIADKIVTNVNDIRFFWILEGYGNSFVTFVADEINVKKCSPHAFNEPEFKTRGGILTLRKTQTHLKIWFDDELELDWDFSVKADCTMKYPARGIQFHLSNYMDTASKEIRFQGKIQNNNGFKKFPKL